MMANGDEQKMVEMLPPTLDDDDDDDDIIMTNGNGGGGGGRGDGGSGDNDGECVISIQTPTGRRMELRFGWGQSVLEVKRILQSRVDIGVRPELMNLASGGDDIDDDACIGDYNGQCLLLTLRYTPQSSSAPSLPALNAHPAYIEYMRRMSEMDMGAAPLIARIAHWDVQIRQSAAANRLFGLLLMAVGVLYFAVGVSQGSWAWVVLGMAMMEVGVLGVRTAQRIETHVARSYYRAVIILAFVVVVITVINQAEAHQGASLAGAVILTLLLPMTFCGACLFCARRHYKTLVCRDDAIMYHHQLLHRNDDNGQQQQQQGQGHEGIGEDGAVRVDVADDVAAAAAAPSAAAAPAPVVVYQDEGGQEFYRI